MIDDDIDLFHDFYEARTYCEKQLHKEGYFDIVVDFSKDKKSMPYAVVRGKTKINDYIVEKTLYYIYNRDALKKKTRTLVIFS